MEYVIRTAAAAAVAAVLSLVVKKSNPELSLLLGLTAAFLRRRPLADRS